MKNAAVFSGLIKGTRATLVLSVVGFSLGVVSCKYLPWSKNAEKQETCISDPSAIKSKKFGLSMEVEGKLKATLLATTSLEKLAKQLDKDTSFACGQLLHDLGGKKPKIKEPGDGKASEKVCAAATKKLEAMREKIANAMTVETEPLRCSQPVSSYTRCARDCDPNLGTDNASVQCEVGTETGTCDGKCEGTCFTSFAKCNGTCYARCSGKCEEGFSGSCGGECDGTCDGESITLKKCEGKCEGKCMSDASGTCNGLCKGECAGTCAMDMSEKAGKCEGKCAGNCSKELSRVECSGVVFPPEIGTQCLAQCRAQNVLNVKCEPAHVKAEVYGEVEPKVAKKLLEAVPKRLPELLKVHEGMRKEVEDLGSLISTSFEAVHTAMDEDPSVKKKINSCVKVAEKSVEKSTASLERVLEAVAAPVDSAKR